MSKLKNIIKELVQKDYEAIYESLMESNAEKSAYLLKFMREQTYSDTKIMNELNVNTNAYYTLRSRLNQKIEEYLLQQMENPRTDLLKKVANINEIIFTKKTAIAVATLKKLEKELLDYDLSNELTIIYKNLKKLHLHSPEHFNYSQLYNKHVAYNLAVDKAEELLSEYFKKYGIYLLKNDPNEKIGLQVIMEEMINVSNLYQSHRLYVYMSCINIFQRLFVDKEESLDKDAEPIEDIIINVERMFEQYYLDSIYYHLKLVFEGLKLEYYNHYGVYKKVEKFFPEVNENLAVLMTNFRTFTFPSQFLLTKLERALRNESQAELEGENQVLFDDFDCDENDEPQFVIYSVYRSLSCFYAGKYDEAARWINNLLNAFSLKRYPFALLEVKTILALQYCLQKDFDLFNQLVNSIQRQIRILGKEETDHIVNFIKILKTSIAEARKNKESKIKSLIDKISYENIDYFAATKYIKMDDEFVALLCK